MANPENIAGQGFHTNPERINRAGKAPGTRNHGTWLRMFAEALIDQQDPLGVFEGKLTAEQAADLKTLTKAMDGDLKAYELMKNYLYGKQTDKQELSGPDGGPVENNVTVEFVRVKNSDT